MTPTLLREVRRRYRKGRESQQNIARDLGISQKHAWRIVHLGDDGLCHECKQEPVHIKGLALGKRCYQRLWRRGL